MMKKVLITVWIVAVALIGFAAVAEAVGALLDDPARAAAMGQAGRKRVLAHYSDSSLAERTLAAYASVLASN